MKNIKDILYISGIIFAALSSYLIDKTQLESNQIKLESTVLKLENELKQTNLAVVVNRLDNLEARVTETNTKMNKLDEKADRILILLAERN